MTNFYPLLFKPVLKDYVWGGRNLAEYLGRSLPPETNIAESWEIAAHANGNVVVTNGSFKGRSLLSLYEYLGLDLIGQNGQWAHERHKFPLLVKILDATKPLSVQVHPDDQYAAAHENNELGKSEMWVVLHAESNARVILGLRHGATAENLRHSIETQELDQWLHEITVKTGDFICVPAGSLHAILDGLLIAEIQQNSDTTYRVYDWGRVGKEQQPRPLHIDKALAVINFEQIEPALPQARQVENGQGIVRWELCRTPYFVTERVEITKKAVLENSLDGSSMEIWGTIQGTATLSGGQETVPLPAVTFALLPAALSDYRIEALGPTTLLRTYLPERNSR